MSDEMKNFIAYIVRLSLLILGLSLFKTWEPPVPIVRGVLMETPQRSAVLPGSARD